MVSDSVERTSSPFLPRHQEGDKPRPPSLVMGIDMVMVGRAARASWAGQLGVGRAAARRVPMATNTGGSPGRACVVLRTSAKG